MGRPLGLRNRLKQQMKKSTLTKHYERTMSWLKTSIESFEEVHFHHVFIQFELSEDVCRLTFNLGMRRYAEVQKETFEQGWYRVLTSSLYWDGVFYFALKILR